MCAALVGRLFAAFDGKSQVEWKDCIVKDRFQENLIPSVGSNLWKDFMDIRSIERKSAQGHPRFKMAVKDHYLFIGAKRKQEYNSFPIQL